MVGGINQNMITEPISQRRSGLSGFICIRNAVELDYCIVESALAMIPVVDELVLCDGESTDGTKDILSDLARSDSRVRVITYPWKNPYRSLTFWTDWLNYARQRLVFDHMLTTDADEVLDPASHDQIRALAGTGRSSLFQRLNFWKDAQHLAPHNRVCGEMVARMGPTELYMPSDEPQPAVSPNVRTNAEIFPSLRIFHYGFLRKPDAFVKKADAISNMFFGSTDPRLAEMQAAGKRWDERDYFDGLPLREFHGQHPEVARGWLRERGYSP